VTTYTEDVASNAGYIALRRLIFVMALPETSFDPLPREYEQCPPCEVSIRNDELALMLACEKAVALGLALFEGSAYIETS
jgi:hypothetical protein